MELIMFKSSVVTLAVVAGFGLAGCSSRDKLDNSEKGAMIGAGAGAAGGAAVSGGSALGTAAGAAVGGVVGHEVGERKDDKD
ncbi:MAG: glycine zipper 2TM domain-containing protein [Burkholderiales bacterium]|nr:glycine zipper 2TM domain-containing protein [Burkholderiales bacterium]